MTMFEAFVERTNSARSAEEVFRAFCDAAWVFGFDYLAYFLLTDHPAQGRNAGFCIEGAKTDALQIRTHECDAQCCAGPAAEAGFHKAHPFTWPALGLSDVTEIQQAVINHAGADRLYDGLGIPIHGANGALAGVGLAAANDGVAQTDDNARSRLMALAMQFHLAYSGHEGAAASGVPVTLTAREREVLLWAAEGKSDGVISDILGITVPTVRFHLQNTFRKLDTNDRTLAVLKAMRQGLITPNFGDTAEK